MVMVEQEEVEAGISTVFSSPLSSLLFFFSFFSFVTLSSFVLLLFFFENDYILLFIRWKSKQINLSLRSRNPRRYTPFLFLPLPPPSLPLSSPLIPFLSYSFPLFLISF